MTRYEETLSKIAPVFHKFVQYREYFYENRQFLVSYLENANMHVFSAIEVEDAYAKYYFSIYRRRFFVASQISPTEEIPYAIIDLFYSNWKGNVGFDGYYYGFIVFIVTLILNNFQFIDKTLKDIRETNFTAYDLFVVLVGKDTYETIINNIK